MGKVLYRKYRSRKLSEVIGQKHVTDILERAIEQGRVSHAYLFTGPRGVGKTSVARILAHEINQFEYKDESSHLDIIEIDAASNNGVEDIRNLREKVAIAPIQGKKKVYIIDEVHMLSKPAFNALLKTLEEPPEHVVFILATTDAHKLPATIISRSQQFVFRLVNENDVVQHLKYISDREKIKIEEEALKLIARKGGGSFRDSISLLDQVSGISETSISREMVENMLGLASDEIVEQLIGAHRAGDINDVVAGVKSAVGIGIKPEMIAEQLMKYIINDLEKHGELLPLVDRLAEIAKASYPEMRLITALAIDVDRGPQKELPESGQDQRKTKAADNQMTNVPDTENVVSTSKAKAIKPFDGAEILQGIKMRHMHYYTLLSQCDLVEENGVLTIYAKKGFWKKKLDEPEFRKLILEELDRRSMKIIDVVIVNDTVPTTDTITRSIADIMGGGEEVPVNV